MVYVVETVGTIFRLSGTFTQCFFLVCTQGATLQLIALEQNEAALRLVENHNFHDCLSNFACSLSRLAVIYHEVCLWRQSDPSVHVHVGLVSCMGSLSSAPSPLFHLIVQLILARSTDTLHTAAVSTFLPHQCSFRY